MSKGQISLEFLVVLFAMLAILLVFMPVFSKLYSAVLLAVDTYNASNSLQELKTNVSMLSTLEQGSSFTFDLKFIHNVDFICQNRTMEFDIYSNLKTKKLSSKIQLNCNFHFNLKGKETFMANKISTKDLNIYRIFN